MAERLQRTRLVPQLDDSDGPGLSRKAWRLVWWAGAATAAVGLACAAAYSDLGVQRPAEPQPGSSEITRVLVTTEKPGSRAFDAEVEARRLSEAVRLLAADRDRLQARVSALERNLDDMTGSIAAGAATAAQTVSEPAPTAAPSASATPTVPPATARQSPLPAVNPPARAVVPTSAAMNREAATSTTSEDSGAVSSVATKTEFAVDLGGATTVAGLRALWQSLHEGHEALFEGLRPLIAVRESGKPGGVELRLVAGPVANAGAAARLCAALSTSGLACQASIFDGQRLSLK